MRWGVLIILIFTLLADVYIYRGVVCKYFRRLPWRLAYIVFAFVTAGAALSIFTLYGLAASWGTRAVITVMWLVFAFFLTALPRLFFAAGAFADWLASMIIRRRVLVFRVLALLLSAAGIAALIYGATAGRTAIKINEVIISSASIPAAFDGYRIAMFADLHLGTMCDHREFVARVVDAVNRLDADLVVNGGDLVNISHRDLEPEIMRELSRIESRDGVVSVWGNHDLGFYIRDTLALPLAENISLLEGKLGEIGWRTLRDGSFHLRRGADSILISGLNFPPDARLGGHNARLSGADVAKAFAGADPSTYSIVVTHSPHMWKEVAGAGFGDLILAAHVHAMQLKLELFGRRWSPAKYLYEEWSGLYKKRDGYLYINDGMGCVGYPIRLGTPPELTLLILRKCE